ncbi:PREDICTED: zinc finger CCHC domain-containing protein 4 [Dinoponera quadriceps]|uniref:Zinc finger CCHC domain-containing protein 4 n=1 Tax=Dinoponera quadriceps TaxID=609295 RepID=A0A6P3Y4Y5_DINQU|nr:PREDICTED: zinc finger CCHC domain-containing protein 4 [Dinoponera quadriceps]XP_014485982.1 PREDICTED: zinc finger CCHC domain-containing protein 4 [Dinoponera quadriceps]
MNVAHGVECFWGDLKKHPQCPHGPTLLFGRYVNGELEKFYACSACRNRKLCTFHLSYGRELSKSQKNRWQQERRKFEQRYHHQKLFIRLNEIKAQSVAKRCYCHDCEKLILISEKDKHNDHRVTENLTDRQMNNPTELLKPLNNVKKEAQYLFSEKSTKDIVSMLLKLGAKQVLCVGTPRIHEYISEYHTDKISSLLLDLDGRFHNFFGPLDYCWYNLFNHHFFNKDAINVFKDFLTQNKGKDTYLICDPPFGGRVEPMSCTIKTISDLHKKLNDNNSDDFSLKVMFMFPYFMEHIMREKSNPPSVAGGLKDLKMSDYKVDYDNHPLFVSGEHGRKQGSTVRIFTNIPLKLLELPASDGYRFCKDCEKWVSGENKHCKSCKECTSKHGRTYKHCKLCKRCVKPTWKHCKTCQRCLLQKHTCGQVPSIVGRCFKCNELGHTGRECSNLSSAEIAVKGDVRKGKIVKKRKAESELKTSLVKKTKVQDSKKTSKRKTLVINQNKTSKVGKNKNLRDKKRSIK